MQFEECGLETAKVPRRTGRLMKTKCQAEKVQLSIVWMKMKKKRSERRENANNKWDVGKMCDEPNDSFVGTSAVRVRKTMRRLKRRNDQTTNGKESETSICMLNDRMSKKKERTVEQDGEPDLTNM